MVDAIKLADLAHLFRRIGTRVTVLPADSKTRTPSDRRPATPYEWGKRFVVGANGNDDGGKRKRRPEQKTEGVEGGEPQQKMPRLAPPDQETTEMVADWMTQLEGMPPEIQMLILQFVLRPRFMPTYRRVGERWERVDLELRQNHAIMETRRLMRAYLALRQTSRYWRSLLLDTSLRIAMYLDWVRSPVMPLWLDTSVPDDKGIYAGDRIDEFYVRRIRETMPELRADVPSTPAWYSIYLANLILHDFMQLQHRDGIKFGYATLVDQSQLLFPRHIYKAISWAVYWDGRLRDEEIVKTSVATPGSSLLQRYHVPWNLEESYFDRVRPPSGTPPGGVSIDTGGWKISLPGLFFETEPLLKPGIRREELLSWWTQIAVTKNPFPNDLEHRRYISFIHYSFIASSVIRIPTSAFPAIKGMTVAFWSGYRETPHGGPTMSVNLHFRRTLFLDSPISVDERGMAPLNSFGARSIVHGKYVRSMGRATPYRRIVLKNVRIGSVSQLNWTLSYMAYSIGDAGYWFDIFATTSKTQERFSMRIHITKDTYLPVIIGDDKRVFHSININRDLRRISEQPLYEFETPFPENRIRRFVYTSSANDPELEQLPAGFRRLYKAYQPLAPGGNPRRIHHRVFEPYWLAEKWKKPHETRIDMMFMLKSRGWFINRRGSLIFSKEDGEQEGRLLDKWKQEIIEALQKYRKQRKQDE